MEASLNSSLMPYAILISGSSFRRATAAAFIKSNARLSLGLVKPYLDDSLIFQFRRDTVKTHEEAIILVEATAINSYYDIGVWQKGRSTLE